MQALETFLRKQHFIVAAQQYLQATQISWMVLLLQRKMNFEFIVQRKTSGAVGS